MPSETLRASWTKILQSLPKGWKLSTLGDECEIIGGGTPKRNNPDYFSGDTPWATPTDVTALDGLYISTTKETVTPEGIASSSTKLLPKGTVLLTSRATIGFTAITVVPICTNQGFANFICKKDLIPEYLAYWLPTQKELMFREAGGTTFKEISKGALKKFEIPVPPTKEQHHIVDILKRADGIRRLRKQAQDTARQLIPALFIDMFGDPATNPKGWPMVTIGDIIESADYGSSTKASSNGAGLPLIRMGNVDYSGSLDLSDLKYVELSAAEVEKYRLQTGDILFNRTNSKELVGKTGLWNGGCEAVAASYFIRVRVKRSDINPFYLWAFMNTTHMKRVLFETARGAIGQSNINAKELRGFSVALPPLGLQDEYERRCRNVFGLETQQTNATTNAEAIFQSLLYLAFSGGASNWP